jgi:hypothetical protein
MGDLPRKDDGLIKMGDLPRRKMIKIWIGLIVMGNLPNGRWSHYDGWPTQMEDNVLIMMGDLPR